MVAIEHCDDSLALVTQQITERDARTLKPRQNPAPCMAKCTSYQKLLEAMEQKREAMDVKSNSLARLAVLRELPRRPDAPRRIVEVSAFGIEGLLSHGLGSPRCLGFRVTWGLTYRKVYGFRVWGFRGFGCRVVWV